MLKHIKTALVGTALGVALASSAALAQGMSGMSGMGGMGGMSGMSGMAGPGPGWVCAEWSKQGDMSGMGGMSGDKAKKEEKK